MKIGTPRLPKLLRLQKRMLLANNRNYYNLNKRYSNKINPELFLRLFQILKNTFLPIWKIIMPSYYFDFQIQSFFYSIYLIACLYICKIFDPCPPSCKEKTVVSVLGLPFTLDKVFDSTYKGLKCFDYNIQINRACMEEGKAPSCENFWTAPEKDFECPCGKSYYSYPALFTHIKNKHEGKAPGNIKKPSRPPKRRGRPPVHTKHSFSETNETVRSEVDSCSFSQPIMLFKLPDDVLQMNAITKILEQLPVEQMDRRKLNEIAAIVDMNVYLVSRQRKEGGLLVGWVISEFLQELSRGVQWGKFQQMLMLLMLWVQYTIDSQQNPRLVAEGQMDVLLDNINDFFQVGLSKMTKKYDIPHLPIFDEEIVLQLFSSFFQWLIAKKYTNYRITLNLDFSVAS